MGKRVLIVNKFYYARGGDCVCTLNLERLLKSKGWDVAVYAMKYPENFASEWQDYFAEEVSFGGGITNKLAAAKRLLGFGDIQESFKKILRDFRPDVVHLQNIHSYLSPIIAKLSKDYGAKVVWTLHDYKLLCPSYSCLNNGNPCELCYTDKSNVIKYRCMKGSLASSIFAYIEAKKWNVKWIERYVDAFICPSSFMAKKMKQGGFSESKLNVICNFVDPEKLDALNKKATNNRENYYLYAGRLSQEKGISTLLKVASTLPYKLKVAGNGPLFDEVSTKYRDFEQIEFLGHQNAEQISNLLSKAIFTVCPSECYENNPLSVIESLCAGTPVVGANIGGIPELISNERTGYIFQPGNTAELSDYITQSFSKTWKNDIIKQEHIERFSPKVYFDKINLIYNN